jgi:glucose/arabinose dehydrogenase
MHARCRTRSALLAVTATLVVAAPAAAQGPPPPVAANGNPVEVVASGVPTPTAFAFAGSTVFAGSGPTEQPYAMGGLFVLKGGKANQVPNTPPVVFGLAWRKGTLYVSSGKDITAYKGWNGTKFSTSKRIYKGKKNFRGFNGLAFGPDGRLYSGLSLNEKYDSKKDPQRLSQAVVSLRPNGKDLRIVARGLRQPFQLVFPKGKRYPYVTVLAQDTGKIPPDAIVVAKPGQNYGFPKCTQAVKKACKGFAKPLTLLPKHSSPMGIGAIGKRLYVSLFGGTGTGPEVVTLPVKGGGKPKPFLTGFAAPVIALGTHGTDVYVGDLTGTIYKVGI